jgi:IS5 family transposase
VTIAPIRRNFINHLPEHRPINCSSRVKGRNGDRANAVLAAAGYNFALLLRWIRRLLRALLHTLFPTAIGFQYL